MRDRLPRVRLLTSRFVGITGRVAREEPDISTWNVQAIVIVVYPIENLLRDESQTLVPFLRISNLKFDNSIAILPC